MRTNQPADRFTPCHNVSVHVRWVHLLETRGGKAGYFTLDRKGLQIYSSDELKSEAISWRSKVLDCYEKRKLDAFEPVITPLSQDILRCLHDADTIL
ncbi:hypothetical protein AVEN_68183-1 [Araneus ventricosus]|uniref:Uncharacterized protein n=1 Tax=Araneus ventricosus TaxID=182803 RepID=A0A4Y2WC26_ARAVE|nr:hypothetical protein AVEN_68183-1 [Araneus ventricosus]